MTAWWTVSYVALWVLVIVLALVVLATLREIGIMRHGAPERRGLPRPAQDGPPLSSVMPELVLNCVNGYEPVVLGRAAAGIPTLVVFLSPMCEGCQLVVDGLNAVAGGAGERLRTVVVLRGQQDQAVRAFLNIFPLRTPVALDVGESVTTTFDTHHVPFALLYDASNCLLRKGSVSDEAELMDLIGALPDEGPRETLVTGSAAANGLPLAQ